LPGNTSVNTRFILLEDCFLCGRCRGYIAPVTNKTAVFLSEGSDIQVSRKSGVQKNTGGLPVRMYSVITRFYVQYVIVSDSWEVSSEDFMCVIVQGELGVRNPVRLVWLPRYEYVKTMKVDLEDWRLMIVSCLSV
jgi:hypothetical protein